jgi:methionyl-tRNA synthetase
MSKRFYLTTPIYYVNGAPHIGHAYTSIASDVLARWKRLDGYDVFFLTGTDEHGQKVEKAARDAGLDPQSFTDQVSADFRDMAARMGVSADDFIRTTEPRHKASCAALWRRLLEAGEIYLGHYEGWYAVRDEAFYGEDELVALPDGTRRAARRWSGCASRPISSASPRGRTGCWNSTKATPTSSRRRRGATR